jgi:hypothetical protein
VDRSGLYTDLFPVSDQRDTEPKDDGADSQLSTDGSEFTILDGDEAPSYHNSGHYYYEQEYCAASFHIKIEPTCPVNRILVARQNES